MELLSCVSFLRLYLCVQVVLTPSHDLQCTTTVTMYVMSTTLLGVMLTSMPCRVSVLMVCPHSSRGRGISAYGSPCIILGYSMTLFQSLANAAGYDPVRGVGTSCSDADASGQCVLPWGSGTKSVSSVVLVANGVSFAVRRFPSVTPSVVLSPAVQKLLFRVGIVV